MSRHSKNNTANSVFSYAEKKKLEKEYGTQSVRLGRDSQKKFEQCFLCLRTVKDPVICSKGHLFCRTCIMENLLSQKKSLDQKITEYDRRKKNEDLKEHLRKREKSEQAVAEFEKDHFELGKLKKLKAHNANFNYRVKTDERQKEEDRKQNVIDTIQHKETLSFDNVDLKKRLIQTSFWMAESDKHRLEDLKKYSIKGMEPRPKRILRCPADNTHQIKIKKIYPLNFGAGTGPELYCKACNKQLGFQKITALRSCGHVMCRSCFREYCEKEEQKMCICGKRYLGGDIIPLIEGMSSFANHNEVVAKKYSPAFAI